MDHVLRSEELREVPLSVFLVTIFQSSISHGTHMILGFVVTDRTLSYRVQGVSPPKKG